MEDIKIRKLGKVGNEIRIYLLDTPIERNAVGMLECDLFEDRLGLIVDPAAEEELQYDYACLRYLKGRSGGVIHMEDRVYQGLKNDGNMETMIILHELGHYCYHHYGEKVTSESMGRKRLKAVRKNTVLPEELQADDFAAGFMGYSAALEALEKMKAEAIAQYAGNEEYDQDEAVLSVKELEMRIEFLRKYGKV